MPPAVVLAFLYRRPMMKIVLLVSCSLLVAGCGSSSPPPTTSASAPASSSATPSGSTPSSATSSGATEAPAEAPKAAGGFGSGGAPWGDNASGADPKSKLASLQPGEVSVTGRLDPEVVKRVVRQNFGRFRLCYEEGLRNNPKLGGGHVTVKFDIDKSGKVRSPSDGGSDLADKNVVACISKAFEALTFPKPESDKTTVVYPLLLSPPSA